MPAGAHKYLAKHATTQPLQGGPALAPPFHQAVVIPALAEETTLPATLASLARNAAAWLADTLVVVVVNNRAPSAAPDAEQVRLAAAVAENQRTLAWFADRPATDGLRLAWIDASSPGHELPDWGGVGLARKIGCDSVLAHLAAADSADALYLRQLVVLSLDADTLVEPGYLADVSCGLRDSGKAAATLRVRHQPADSAKLQAAIDQYESFLEYYAAGLRYAGSPYAFIPVGSALAFTAESYVAAAGFPARRQAGEDFYFLQQLWKVGGVMELPITVHPSPRPSWRVPFGTGPRMAEALAAPETEFAAYDPRVFVALRELLTTAMVRESDDAPTVLRNISCGKTVEFLQANEFGRVRAGFLRQHRTPDARRYAFACWFDGFRTLKLIHHLTEHVWPKVPLDDAWTRLRALGPRSTFP